MRTWQAVPGVNAGGHITSGGAWHPSRAEGCVKCGPANTPADKRRAEQRARSYAAKFRAETVLGEPPREVEPTDDNLRRILSHGGLVRPAKRAEYPAIRAALANWKD